MKTKAVALTLAVFLVVSPAAAFSFSDLLPGKSTENYMTVTEEQAEDIEFSSTGANIVEKTGFFSIIASGETGPGDEVTFESTVNIDNFQTACDNPISPPGIKMKVWLEGQGVSAQNNYETLYFDCYGSSSKDVSLNFDVPREEGEFTYDLQVGETIDGSTLWSRNLETDSVTVEVESIEADISQTKDEVVVGEELSLTGARSTGYGGIDKYKWIIDGQTVSTDSMYTTSFDEAGTVNIDLEVSDYSFRDDYLGERRWDTAETTVEVLADSDGDGIPDENDDCPNEAGSETYDGCPDPDPDGDNVPRWEDDCPDEAGLESLDGCPNTAPEINDVGLSSSTVEVGETLTVSVSASEQDGQDLRYTVEAGGQTVNKEEAAFQFDSSGSKTVSVEVTDGIETVSETKQVTVEKVQESEPDNPDDGNQTEEPDDNQTGDGQNSPSEGGTDDSSEEDDSTEQTGNVFSNFINSIIGIFTA